MSLERGRIWKRIEIVGDIAVIPIPFDFEMNELRAYADEVMGKTKVKSVWGRKRDVSGIYRLPTYVHLAGENRSDTIYREHGCSYYLDLRKVFFSEKLSYEHKRIAEKVRPGERVANLFSGFGPISILAYKLRKPAVVYSIDINPYAYYFMMVNVELNSAYGVIPMYGDAFVRLNQLEPLDRIISPLPERDREAYELSMSRLKPGGHLHLFAEVEANRDEDPVSKAMASFPGAVEGRVVRSVNPGKYHVILDIRKNT
ncbi:methyltransferase [Metallosphaera sedula]|uniref:Methyltransferase n=3 Tax=Metallosphaera TaxID=41980 RepID=A4YEC6_METS5|nr:MULTISPECIES: SAM-dependent methyltransferase [Metallosphaera]ABP94778.1 methyltransferase [Metallosphaera sedula DSM 5348]AIM26765.1 methyltransferase [Metallosphaera sedula]AKV73720.1 methyltransferase [Metallosphaera sedula]AKV75960.1 methyltransferase [Metallosphaera sedula]AKV78211.1 methyltransferase [Metallosphaera sedula]